MITASMRIITIVGITSFLLYWLLPERTQIQIDELVEKLSNRIKEISFANFSTLETTSVYALLATLFRCPVWTVSFYLRVGAASILLTSVGLLLYTIVPFTDPLNVQLIGYWPFVTNAFFLPNYIVAIISFGVTNILLWISGRAGHFIFYVVIVIADAAISVYLLGVIIINVEFTRDMLLAVYHGDVQYSALFSLSIFRTAWIVLKNLRLIDTALQSTFYIQNKYKTYYPTIITMFTAITPIVMHLLVAGAILLSRVMHDWFKPAVGYGLHRIVEIRWAFNFMARFCTALVAVLALIQWLGG